MRFYLDENIEPGTVQYLRELGHNVYHAVLDGNHMFRGDRFHFRQAKKLRRVLLTCDRDFENRREFNVTGHPGIIMIEVGSLSTADRVNAVLAQTLNRFRTNTSVFGRKVVASLHGCVVIGPEGRVQTGW